MFKLSIQNQANYMNFEKTDVIITTPTQFDLLNNYGRIKNLNPKFLIIDEADNLLDSNVNHVKALNNFLALVNFQSKLKESERHVTSKDHLHCCIDGPINQEFAR